MGVTDGGARVAFGAGSGWWRAEAEGRGERDKLVSGGGGQLGSALHKNDGGGGMWWQPVLRERKRERERGDGER